MLGATEKEKKGKNNKISNEIVLAYIYFATERNCDYGPALSITTIWSPLMLVKD